MFCEKCGREIKEASKFCPYCGCEIKNNTLNNRKISNTEIGHQTNKKKSKVPFIIGIGVVIVLIIILIPKGKNAKQTVDKLQSFTYMTEDDGIYKFEYGDEWDLGYSTINEWVDFYDSEIYECLIYALDTTEFGNEGKFGYDFSDNEFRVYVDYQAEEGELTIINYSLDDDEFILMMDGEKYEASEELEQDLRDSGLIEIFEDDLDIFKRQLEDNGTSFDEVKKLSYDKLKEFEK